MLDLLIIKFSHLWNSLELLISNMINRFSFFFSGFVICIAPFCFWPLLIQHNNSELFGALAHDLRRNLSFRDSSFACFIVTIPSALNAIVSILFSARSNMVDIPADASSEKKFVVLSHGERLIFLIGSAILSAV